MTDKKIIKTITMVHNKNSYMDDGFQPVITSQDASTTAQIEITFEYQYKYGSGEWKQQKDSRAITDITKDKGEELLQALNGLIVGDVKPHHLATIIFNNNGKQIYPSSHGGKYSKKKRKHNHKTRRRRRRRH